MAKRKKNTAQITIQNPDAAGIDIGSRKHYVAIPVGRDDKSVRSFGVFTKDLNEMANWLVECGITTVAMESTGVYWVQVFQMLEDYGLQVILVNASHVKNVPGRKTDVSDCQWIQQLHSFGLLRGSFRPQADVTKYRSLVRQRDKLIKGASDHVRRMQKSLELMNLHLHKVINDITGKTGIKIIQAIIQGERDPNTLAKMKDPRIRNSVETIRLALEGDWRDEHLFVLEQEYDLYVYYHKKIKQCDEQIEAHLTQMHQGDPSDMPTQANKKQKNDCDFDLRGHLYQLTGVDLCRINGISIQTAQIILSECGYDMSKWPTEKHFASWLGLSPNNKITGDQVKSSRTRKVTNRAANAFRLSARSLHHSKSALGAQYRRLKNRIGPMKANTAMARRLSNLTYMMLKNGVEFVDKGMEYYEEKYRERSIKNLQRNAERLGFKIVDSQQLSEVVT